MGFELEEYMDDNADSHMYSGLDFSSPLAWLDSKQFDHCVQPHKTVETK